MEELVEKAKIGDREAFTMLILSLENDLYRIAKLRLKNDDDIYDAVQESLIIAFESIKKLKEPKFFKTWLIKILMNQSNNIYRKKNKRKLISFEEIQNSQSVDSNIENTEAILDLDLIYNKLKYEDKAIIILFYIEKFTDKEISEILHLKENTVTTKRTRAKQKIKKILEIGEKNNG